MFNQYRIQMLGFLIYYALLAQAHAVDHPYPRTGIFHWGGARIEMYAKYDLIYTRNSSIDFARGIKNINPNALVLCARDFNGGMTLTDYPAEWYVRNSQGKNLTIYGGAIKLLDYSNYCPKASYKGYTNIRYNEFVALYMKSLVDLTVYDGVATDGLWDTPWSDQASTDIDLDRNGVNDNTEHGWSWVVAQWTSGAGTLVTNVRNAIGPNKYFLINGTSVDAYRSLYNGFIFEYGSAIASNWYSGFGWYQNMISDNPLRSPQAIYIDGCNAWDWNATESTNIRNNFRLMRFSLVTTMLGNGYFGYQPQYKDHYVLSYYDEMDLDLGQPSSGNYTMKCVDGKCVYVRFFQKGVVILNVTGASVTVSDADIHFPAYNGPYYFFEGGQNPEWNTGLQFTSATLAGSKSSTGKKYLGDALILLKTRQKVVSEIVVDNYVNDTSPGSDPALFVGNWTQDCGYGAWTMGCGAWLGQYSNAYSFSGSGENRAIFSPKIGVTGAYDVYEWHGTPSVSTPVATDAPFTLAMDGSEVARLNINQSQNKSQWNKVGRYYLTKGANVQMTITNDANGLVVADAVKLVFQGEDSDVMPPLSPTGLKLDKATENSLRLSWQAPQAASDGDTVMFYSIYRDEKSVGISYKPIFTDTKLSENTQYSYKIIGHDNSGNSSTTPLTGNFSTTSDLNGPKISKIWPIGSMKVEVFFDEPVDPTTAAQKSNYQIETGVSVTSAKYDNTSNKVILTTTTQTSGQKYTLLVNNVKDMSSAGNTANTQSDYVAVPDPLVITLAADNEYELYVNGTFIGSGNVWPTGTRYEVSSVVGKNVIAVKGIDTGGYGGFLAEIEFMGKKYVTNTTWKVSKVEQTDWQTIDFNDLAWAKATSYGLHGTATPWASYQNVANISTTANVNWIWSSDWENDDTVFFRLTLQTQADVAPPSAPQGVQVKLQ